MPQSLGVTLFCRASLKGNRLKVEATIYPTRAADLPPAWIAELETRSTASPVVVSDVEWDGERLERVRLRTASCANWPSVAFSAAGNLLPDFPLINKSFELCYACVDR